jgi:glucokinase
MRAKVPSVLAIDIGGTKLAAGVVRDDGVQLSRGRVPTDVGQGPDAAVERLLALCRQVVAQAGLRLSELPAVGVGCGGPLDTRRGVTLAPPNLPGWDEFPLVSKLEAALGRPVHLDNDANAAALGEHRFGAGRGFRHLVYLTISTGIGGGVILDDRLYRGANGNAAELGHIQVSYDGWPCPCGGQGCIEAFASGTHIARRAREKTGRPELTSHDVVAGVRAGDSWALAVWDDTLQVLSAGIASMINAFNPQRVIIGGGVTAAGELLFEPLRRLALARAMKPLAQGVDLVPAQLEDQVGVMGAAAVAFAAAP